MKLDITVLRIVHGLSAGRAVTSSKRNVSGSCRQDGESPRSQLDLQASHCPGQGLRRSLLWHLTYLHRMSPARGATADKPSASSMPICRRQPLPVRAAPCQSSQRPLRRTSATDPGDAAVRDRSAGSGTRVGSARGRAKGALVALSSAPIPVEGVTMELWAMQDRGALPPRRPEVRSTTYYRLDDRKHEPLRRSELA
jgi:hypothetical protein